MEPLRTQQEFTSDEVRLLGQFVDSFNGAASRFEEYYHQLEQKVKELDVELQSKNAELNISLKEKEEVKNHLHNILESLTSGVVVIDLQGRIVTFNRAAEQMTGLASAQVKGKQFEKVFGPTSFGNPLLSLSSVLAADRNTEIETEIHPKEGRGIQVTVSISPVKDPKGNKVGIVLTLQDMTLMKKLEEQASRTDRLAAMGEMAVKIAHEVRNPLGSIELFATLLKKELQEREDLQSLAEHISSGVKSINTTISNLLLFIRPHQNPDFKTIDIHDPLNDSVFFSSHLFTSDDSLRVKKDYAAEPIMIDGDLELLKQVALNLILNGIQAMPKGGTLTISSRKATDPATGAKQVKIRFADTGTGIPKEDKTRIFDPFFTTKERGTGLGLAIVHKIVEMHGGTIEIDSRREVGTECVVTLPLREEEHEPRTHMLDRRDTIKCKQNRY